ncbi:MAG: hypothetical protein D6685_16670 [Bacteroidetes bacterium]|nr:MAG: hypothetical protein D6685_16670 [Bacteroidota bacterium]
MTNDGEVERVRSRIRLIGIGLSGLMLWNGVCDYLYGYDPELSGLDYFTPAVSSTILTANGRPHRSILLAQTAGWLYPLYAFTYYPWWIGVRRAGFWLGRFPILLLVYAVLMIGGIQHAGWAFLTVLEQARAAVGSRDPTFFALANRYTLEHFAMGDVTAVLALSLGAVLLAAGIASGRTSLPRWFVLASPLGALATTLIVGTLLPAPYAGWVLAPFGTWFLLLPNIAGAVWLWRHLEGAVGA